LLKCLQNAAREVMSVSRCDDMLKEKQGQP
jgi:hypothetical protein